MRHALLSGATTLIAVTAACGTKDAAPPKDTVAVAAAVTTPTSPPVLTVTAKDYSFDAPASVPGGVVRIHLVNQGPSLHHVALVKLGEGKTVDSLLAAMKKPGPLPAWATELGGPNPPVPGGTSDVITKLEPGSYAILCFVDLPDHVPHFAKGMSRALTVTPATGPEAPLPTPDVTIKLADYAFDLPTLSAGKHVIRIVNDGPQPHEVLLVQFAPGKGMQDFAKWAETYKGEPPGKPLGGVSGITKGTEQFIEVDLTPGTYGLLCLLPDVKDGKPHFMHGMSKQFEVKA